MCFASEIVTVVSPQPRDNCYQETLSFLVTVNLRWKSDCKPLWGTVTGLWPFAAVNNNNNYETT